MTEAYRKDLEAKFRSCVAGETVRNAECVHLNKAGQELKGRFTLQLLTGEKSQPDAICMRAELSY